MTVEGKSVIIITIGNLAHLIIFDNVERLVFTKILKITIIKVRVS